MWKLIQKQGKHFMGVAAMMKKKWETAKITEDPKK